ncbi:hypothetical protein V3528_07880 [Acinetobacter johnsonii]|uniref:hypothetical protein n=1 Tax=Acinetobacter johnsonii TaxID=40214 RepID=UPI0030F95DB9
MDSVQKENDKYLVSLVANCGATQDEINDLNFDDETGFFESNRLADWFISQINFGWRVWQAAKAQAVPEGFVLVPVKEITTWYLDDREGIYREDPEWLCDIPVGEVVEVEHRVSYELDQDPVFAAIQWDEENSDVGYYETFKSKVEAEKVAAHCKAMVETQEQSHE